MHEPEQAPWGATQTTAPQAPPGGLRSTLPSQPAPAYEQPPAYGLEAPPTSAGAPAYGQPQAFEQPPAYGQPGARHFDPGQTLGQGVVQDVGADAGQRQTGVKNIVGGIVLIGIGLLFGGSVFLGNPGVLDWIFDGLGTFWVCKGLYEVFTA